MNKDIIEEAIESRSALGFSLYEGREVIDVTPYTEEWDDTVESLSDDNYRLSVMKFVETTGWLDVSVVGRFGPANSQLTTARLLSEVIDRLGNRLETGDVLKVFKVDDGLMATVGAIIIARLYEPGSFIEFSLLGSITYDLVKKIPPINLGIP